MGKRNKAVEQARKKFIDSWEKLVRELQTFSSDAEVYPDDAWAVIRSDAEGDLVKLELAPVVVKLPEKAYSAKADLCVAFSGTVTGEWANPLLHAVKFSTRVGYFRLTSSKLSHVYGAHYDYSDRETGHPLFHSQLKTFQDKLAPYVRERLNLDDTIAPEDLMRGILTIVRVPSAQVDFLGLFLQLFADHLLYKDSPRALLEAFTLLANDERIVTSAALYSEMDARNGNHCLRSRHWYPRDSDIPNP